MLSPLLKAWLANVMAVTLNLPFYAGVWVLSLVLVTNCAESTLWTSEHRLRVIKKFDHVNAVEESID